MEMHGHVLFPNRESVPPSNACFLGPTWVHNSNGISIGSAVFAQMTARCPYTLQWTPFFPSKLPIPMEDLDPRLIRGSLGPPESSAQMESRSVQPFSQGSLVWQTDRPTDHATQSATIGSSYQFNLLYFSACLLSTPRVLSWCFSIWNEYPLTCVTPSSIAIRTVHAFTYTHIHVYTIYRRPIKVDLRVKTTWNHRTAVHELNEIQQISDSQYGRRQQQNLHIFSDVANTQPTQAVYLAGMVLFAGKTVWSMPERFVCTLVQKGAI